MYNNRILSYLTILSTFTPVAFAGPLMPEQAPTGLASGSFHQNTPMHHSSSSSSSEHQDWQQTQGAYANFDMQDQYAS